MIGKLSNYGDIMDLKRFSIRLKSAIDSSTYNQKRLADEVGLSKSAIYYFTAGSRAPAVDTLVDICNALRVSPDELLQDSLEKKPVASSESALIAKAYAKASEADRLAVRAILSKFDNNIEV